MRNRTIRRAYRAELKKRARKYVVAQSDLQSKMVRWPWYRQLFAFVVLFLFNRKAFRFAFGRLKF